ncbi:glycosyltransferase family 2 protein [Escherichia coli]|nr:glycosyltransferase family A protein [Escherichia coli]
MISVVMPVYNSEKYLAEAIQSILNQTHKNFELICINDGSTDKSQEIIEYFSSRDARIVVINQPNKGVVSSLNLAISLAKYDYIARMDADD